MQSISDRYLPAMVLLGLLCMLPELLHVLAIYGQQCSQAWQSSCLC